MLLCFVQIVQMESSHMFFIQGVENNYIFLKSIFFFLKIFATIFFSLIFWVGSVNHLGRFYEIVGKQTFYGKKRFCGEKKIFFRWWNIDWTHKWKENRSASMQIIVYSLRIFLVNVCFKILLNICCGLFVQQPTKKNLTNSAMQYLPWTRAHQCRFYFLMNQLQIGCDL